MKLVSVRLRNFRCYEQETTIDIDDLTVIVGKNDAGKSSIFDALAVFFEEASLDPDDASIGGDPRDVRVICEFEDLPEALVLDAGYETTLADEYLLNERGRLEIHKVYNATLQVPRCTGTYAYALHPAVPQPGSLLLLKNNELKLQAFALDVDLSDIDSRVNTQLRRRIWGAYDDLKLKPQEIPLDRQGAKKLWDQLKKYLPGFALFRADRPSTDQDAEAQDPMRAAVKEALLAHQAELDALTEHVRREVYAIAEKTVAKLQEMDPTLASELRPQFQRPNWSNVFKISLTGDDAIPINKRGSGVRRLVLLNFFRARAEQAASDRGAPNVIYAIEEPETSQHPNNQRMLMRAFYQLADLPNCQVMLTTHTPVLARQVPAESLRYVHVEDGGRRRVLHPSEETYHLAATSLGVLPDHDVKLFVGVEGKNDINFLINLSRSLAAQGEPVPDLGRLEEEGRIIFFPLGGSNLALWTSRLAGLNVPEFYIFDRDEAPPAQSRYQSQVDAISARRRCAAVLTAKREIENYLHPAAIRAVRPHLDLSFGDFDDVPMLVARALYESNGNGRPWSRVPSAARRNLERKAKTWLNTEAAAAMTPALLDERDPDGQVRDWLRGIQQIVQRNGHH